MTIENEINHYLQTRKTKTPTFTISELIEHARNHPETKLHKAIDWDPKTCAQQWQTHQMTQILNRIRIHIIPPPAGPNKWHPAYLTTNNNNNTRIPWTNAQETQITTNLQTAAKHTIGNLQRWLSIAQNEHAPPDAKQQADHIQTLYNELEIALRKGSLLDDE